MYEESVENRVAIALTENPQNEIAVLALADYEDETISIREFDTLKSKKVPQSLEIGLFFCQIFIFII